MKRVILVALTSITICLLFFMFWYSPSPPVPESNSVAVVSEEMVPLPTFSPQEVVNMQLKALQENDQPYKNHGIEVAFRFASPSNKESTGPLNKFIGLVSNETYQSLLNFRQYGLDDIEIKGDKALQKVTLIDAEDQPAVYYFQLSRQQEAPYTDCWMTDGVVRY